jgi:hypothetical protein
MLGFKRFETAAVTIRGIELAEKMPGNQGKAGRERPGQYSVAARSVGQLRKDWHRAVPPGRSGQRLQVRNGAPLQTGIGYLQPRRFVHAQYVTSQ